MSAPRITPRTFTIRKSDVDRCPIRSLAPSHYHDDGRCRCVRKGHVILVAVEVYADDRADAQRTIQAALQPILASNGGPAECWWVAEDVRYDGSDNDSAVFVPPGSQGVASRVTPPSRAHA